MPYTETNFLLDQRNITDTINRLWWSVDRGDMDTLLDRILAADVTADYTALLGGEAKEVKAINQVEMFKGMIGALDGVHHANTTVIVDLPQPSDDPAASRPTEVNAHCNTIASMMRSSAEGGPICNAGGYYDYVLIRDINAPKGQNPWRVKYWKAHQSWSIGNPHVVPRAQA